MDEADLEGIALAAYAEAGLDADEPMIGELARRLVGPVIRAHGMSFRGDAALDDGRILVRPKAAGWPLRWAVAHEVAEFLLLRQRVMSEQQEQLAERLAASLLAPHTRARRVCRWFGPRFRIIATELRLHPYAAVLRFGEVTSIPTELGGKGCRLRRRGAEWPGSASGSRRNVLERVARWCPD